jgi:hypothetical protein
LQLMPFLPPMDQARVAKRHSVLIRLSSKLDLPPAAATTCASLTRGAPRCHCGLKPGQRPHPLQVTSFRMMHRNSSLRSPPPGTRRSGQHAPGGPGDLRWRLGGVDGCRVDSPLAPCRIERPSIGRIPSEAVASNERPGKGDGQPEHEGQNGRRKGPLSHSPRMGQVTLQAIIRR